jgi:uncharacterized membrane protein
MGKRRQLVIDSGGRGRDDKRIPMSSLQVFWPYLTLLVFLMLAFAATARELRKARGIDKAEALGRVSLAVPMAVFGADHLSQARAIVNGVPAYMPARAFWVYFVGIALIAAALSIIFRVWIRLSATLLGIMLLCFVAMIHLPNAMAAPHDRIAWTIVARDTSFGAGAILLGMVSGSGRRSTGEDPIARAALYVIAAITMFFGVEHFLHPECVPGVPLLKVVPGWIPMARLWTPLTGVLLVAGAAGLLVKSVSRQVAAALGLWVLLLVLSLYLAIMLAQRDVEGVNYFADTMVFAGVLLIASRVSYAK